MDKKNVLIAGGTGLIGKILSSKLKLLGYTPIILSTSNTNEAAGIYRWDPNLKVHDLLPLGNYCGVINLAGASIADTKWNNEGKKLINSSRINSTLYLKNVIDTLPNQPKHIISASAIGYYGFLSSEIKTESSEPGKDFAAQVCKDWEAAAKTLESENCKLSIIRIGIVLAKNGGFYKKIKDLAHLKIAAPIGTGKQAVAWIHVNDLVSVFISILENTMAPGIYNAITQNNTNKEVTKQIAVYNNQPFIWPAIPGFILRILFGSKSEIFLKSSEISAEKLKRNGFVYEYEQLILAISNLAKTTE